MDPELWELIDAGESGDEIAAVLRLGEPGKAPQGVRIVAQFGEIATVRMPRGAIQEVRESAECTSMKAPGAPLGPDLEVAFDEAGECAEVEEPDSPHDDRRPPGLEPTGRGVIVGVVDWGFDFAHPDFRNPDGSTRILALWDQRGSLQPDSPPPYEYGRMHDREAINRALVARDPYTALGYHPAVADTGRGSHGTHVGSIAAGSGEAGGPMGIAPEADLIFVHLATWGGKQSKLGDSVTLLEAIDFISRLAGKRCWSINLSMGRHGEQHDGTTLVEQGLDAVLRAAPGRAICQSTGNYFHRRIHASGQLRPGDRHVLTWQVSEADVTPNELEVWYSWRDTLEVELRAPDGTITRAGLGDQAVVKDGAQEAGRLYHRAREPNTLDHHISVFLYKGVPPGDWEVSLIGHDVVDGRFHAWIERDSARPHCQSFFKDDDPQSTTGTICNGLRTIAIGAYNAHEPDEPLAPFSSSGPTRDGRVKPDICAPGVAILAARSAPRKGADQATLLTRMSGTSMAAPHITGTVALMFEVAPRPLRIEETHNLLLTSARKVASENAERCGSGYLNIERAVSAARNITPLGVGSRPAIERESESIKANGDKSSQTLPCTECARRSAGFEAAIEREIEGQGEGETESKPEIAPKSESEPEIEAAEILEAECGREGIEAGEPESANEKEFADAIPENAPGRLLVQESPQEDVSCPECARHSPAVETLSESQIESQTEKVPGRAQQIESELEIDSQGEREPEIDNQADTEAEDETENTPESAQQFESEPTAPRFVFRVDEAIAAGQLNGSPTRLIAEVQAELGEPASALSVADLFLAQGDPAGFVMIGPPGALLKAEPQPGDILCRRGEGGLAHAAVIAGNDYWPRELVEQAGLVAEGMRPGIYVPVVESGAVPHASSDGFARLLADLNGRVPPDQMVLRPVREAEDSLRPSPEFYRWIQAALNQLLGLQLEVTGNITPQTAGAIRQFQQERGLVVDGVVGPITERAIVAAGIPARVDRLIGLPIREEAPASASAPKGPVLVSHMHIRTTCSKAGDLVRDPSPIEMTQGNMNPGFIDASDEIVFDAKLTEALAKLMVTKYRALLAKKSVKEGGASSDDRIRVGLVDLTGPKCCKPQFAGWGSTMAMSGASTPKIGVLYAAAQLVFDVRQLAISKAIATTAQLLHAARENLKAHKCVPDLAWALEVDESTTPVDVKASHALADNFLGIVEERQHRSTSTASELIMRLGFEYIASVLWQAGLHHPKRGGLWIGSTYCTGHTKAKPNPLCQVFSECSKPLPGKFVWKNDPLKKRAIFLSALSGATFFTLLAQGRLVSKTDSEALEQLLAKACTWFPNALPGATVRAAKCGLTKNLLHDAGLIENEGRRYAVAFLTRGANAALRAQDDKLVNELIRDFDQLIKDNNP